MTSRILRSVALVAVAASMAAGCGGADSDNADGTGTTVEAAAGAQQRAEDFAAVAETYADLVLANYQATVSSAIELQDEIDAFIAGPTDATLEAARDQWLAARDVYGPTEAFRFYDGPVDDPDDGPEGQIVRRRRHPARSTVHHWPSTPSPSTTSPTSTP